MSKKRVDEALALYAQENLAEAAKALGALDQAFVRKRLLHLAAIGRVTREQALILWQCAFPFNSIPDFPSPIQRSQAEPLDALGSAPPGQSVSSGGELPVAAPPRSGRIRLSQPLEFLQWLGRQRGKEVALDAFEMAQPWGLVALATVACLDGEPALSLWIDGTTRSGRFAHAMGVPEAIEGRQPVGIAEEGRTVKLRRVDRDHFPQLERIARDISTLLVSYDADGSRADLDAEEVRLTVHYVIVELLRNVLQHSRDPLGGIVAAQSMNRGGEYEHAPAIQIAVADSGIGIHAALTAMHSDISTPEVALERALWPYFSGVFDSTKRGASQNAGLGLFFVSEMAKLSGGRLLLSSRGASLFLKGAPDGSHNSLRYLPAEFPGTLVVFEVPKQGIADYDAMMRTITARATERASRRSRHTIVRYDIPPERTFEIVVRITNENTVAAHELAQTQLSPRLAQKEPVCLNFANVEVCTQSFVHALLFEPVRVAWSTRTPIYARNASPAVRDGLKLLESYALADG